MVDYSEVLRRLKAYREKLNMTKDEMARMFGVHPTHYGKLEAGTIRISYEGLNCFACHGGDIYYLFTGHERESGPIENYLSECKTKAGQVKLLNVLVAFIELGTWLEGIAQTKVSLDEMPPTMHRSLRLMELEGKEYTLWEKIRKIELLTQEQIAKELDIDVKRYREIEKGETLPTVEIIYAMYCRLDYSPQLFFDREKFYVDELNHYWNRLSEENKQYFASILDRVICKIVENETK